MNSATGGGFALAPRRDRLPPKRLHRWRCGASGRRNPVSVFVRSSIPFRWSISSAPGRALQRCVRSRTHEACRSPGSRSRGCSASRMSRASSSAPNAPNAPTARRQSRRGRRRPDGDRACASRCRERVASRLSRLDDRSSGGGRAAAAFRACRVEIGQPTSTRVMPEGIARRGMPPRTGYPRVAIIAATARIAVLARNTVHVFCLARPDRSLAA